MRECFDVSVLMIKGVLSQDGFVGGAVLSRGFVCSTILEKGRTGQYQRAVMYRMVVRDYVLRVCA